MDFPKISIVIPVFNEEQYLAQCLESIQTLDYPLNKLEVLLVDNGSTDKSVDIAKQYGFKVIVKTDVNVGGVRNWGVKNTTGEVIVFLDSDCVVNPNWLKDGIDCLDGYEAIGGLCLLRDNASWIERGWILNSADNHVYQTTLVGACIFIFREAFNKIDGFDENLTAGEDCDLSERLMSSGRRINIDPRISVIHLGFPNTIMAFIKRQIWHSENCYQRLPKAFLDKTFIITHLYIISAACFFYLVFSSTPAMIIKLASTGVIALPAVLTLKRTLRHKVKPTQVKIIFMAYMADTLYLIGRSLGAAKSLKRFFKKP